MTQLPRKISIFLCVVLGVLIAVVVAARSPASHRMVLNMGAGMLSNAGYELAVGKTGGTWPWHINLKDIELKKSGKLFVSATELDLHWSPLRALRGSIDVRSLRLGDVRIHMSEGTGERGRLPTLDDLPRLKIRDLEVASLILVNMDGVASEAFVLSGQSETAPGRADIEVALLPHDATKTDDQAILELQYDRGADLFSLTSDIELGKHGLLAWLGEDRVPLPISIVTESQGRASAFEVQNTFVLGDLTSGNLTLACNCLTGETLSLAGAMATAGLNFERLPFSVDGPLSFASDLSWLPGARRLEAQNLHIETSGARLEADLTLDDMTSDGAAPWTLSGEARLIARDGLLADPRLGTLFLNLENVSLGPDGWSADRLRLETLNDFVEASGASLSQGGAFSARLAGTAHLETLFADLALAVDLGPANWSAAAALSPARVLTLSSFKATTAKGAIALSGEASYHLQESRLEARMEATASSVFISGDLNLAEGSLIKADIAATLFGPAPDLTLTADLGNFTWGDFMTPPTRLEANLAGPAGAGFDEITGDVRLIATAASPDLSSFTTTFTFQPQDQPVCTISGALTAEGRYAGDFSLCMNAAEKNGTPLWQGLLEAKNFYGGPLAGDRAALHLTQTKTVDGTSWSSRLEASALGFASVKIESLKAVAVLQDRIDGRAATLRSAELVLQDTGYTLKGAVQWQPGAQLPDQITIRSDDTGFLTLHNESTPGKLVARFEAKGFKLPVTPALLDGTARIDASKARQSGRFDLQLSPQTKNRRQASFALTGNWDGKNLTGTGDMKVVAPEAADAVTRIAAFDVPLIATFDAKTALKKTGPASAAFFYEGPLARLLALAPIYDHTIRGDLKIEASVREKDGKAVWQGSAALENGRYTYKDQGLHIEGVHIDADLSGIDQNLESTIRIRQYGPDRKRATLKGDGTLVFHSLQDWSGALDITLDKNSLLQHTNYTGSMSGKLSLKANPKNASLDGRIKVDRINGTIPPPPEIKIVALTIIPVDEAGQPVARPGRQKGSLLLPELALNVVLEAEEQIFVRGRGLDTEWGGKLALTGTSNTPLVDGALVLTRGSLMFGGRPFAFEKGEITMSGAHYKDPFISLTASNEVGDGIEARIVVEGRASAPVVRFESTPPLPEEDIVAYVLFGKPVIELGPTEALRTVVALAQVSGRGGFGTSLMDRTRQAIGVDVLQFTAPAGGEADEGSTLTVGKYLTSGVFLSISEDFGTGVGSAGVEIKVTDSISLGAKVDETSETEASIEWRRDY